MDDLDRVIGDLQDELKRLYRAIERQGKSADKVKQQYHDAQLKMDALLAYKRPIKSTGDIIRRSNRAMARWISPRCCPPVRGCNRPKPYAAPAECNQCWIKYLDSPVEDQNA